MPLQPCSCGSAGSSTPQCDLTNGRCQCREGFTGKSCDQCAPGYYGYPACSACICDMAGTDEKFCNTTLGVCDCQQSGECVCKVTQPECVCVCVCFCVHLWIIRCVCKHSDRRVGPTLWGVCLGSFRSVSWESRRLLAVFLLGTQPRLWGAGRTPQSTCEYMYTCILHTVQTYNASTQCNVHTDTPNTQQSTIRMMYIFIQTYSCTCTYSGPCRSVIDHLSVIEGIDGAVRGCVRGRGRQRDRQTHGQTHSLTDRHTELC